MPLARRNSYKWDDFESVDHLEGKVIKFRTLRFGYVVYYRYGLGNPTMTTQEAVEYYTQLKRIFYNKPIPVPKQRTSAWDNRSRFYRDVLQKVNNEIHPRAMGFRGCLCRLTACACFGGHKVQENTFSLISMPAGQGLVV